MMRAARATVLTLSVIVSGCSGGGAGDDAPIGAAYCAGNFFGGSAKSFCINCTNESQSLDKAIDDSASTYAKLGIQPQGGQITVTATASEGTTFPTGADAGALMRFPTGTFLSIAVQFNTYLNGDPVDVLTGGDSAVGGTVSDAGTATFYSLEPSGAFDTLEAVVSVTGNMERAEFLLYEFCGDR
jgi:hypothetical protein